MIKYFWASVLHYVCTWPGNKANGLQCSGLFVARDRKLERRQRLKRVNPLPGGTTGATVSKIIQTITAILVCHCVSVCFSEQPISYRAVRVYYFASTPSPSLKILVSFKSKCYPSRLAKPCDTRIQGLSYR